MTFGDALNLAINEDAGIARDDWEAHTHVKVHKGITSLEHSHPFLAMYSRKICPWKEYLPSQEDLFATNWAVYKPSYSMKES